MVNVCRHFAAMPIEPARARATYAFLILPGFPMGCLTWGIEPLRAANEIAERPIFRWLIVGETTSPVSASAGFAFAPDVTLDALSRVDALFVLSNPQGLLTDARRAYARLRRLDRDGVILGAFSGGVFPLARAGLLDGYRVSVHWYYETAFRAEFPTVLPCETMITIDRRRQTAAGANAVLDLMLHHVAQLTDPGIATEVACWFQHPLARVENLSQRRPGIRSAITDDMFPEAVARAIRLFEENIEFPVQIAEVARTLQVSERQLERAFKRATGLSPLRYYRMLRMRKARQLVLFSSLSVSEIALAVGYSSSGRLVHHYREAFGISPREERARRMCPIPDEQRLELAS